MYKIQKQAHREAGIFPWEDASPCRYATREEAEKAMQEVAAEYLEDAPPPGDYSARFRVHTLQ